MRSAIPRLLFLICLIFTALSASVLLAAPIKNHPITLSQPNGAQINCFLSGDEYFHWVHDRDGYTIVQDLQTGYYTYAILVDGIPSPSSYVVGEADPASAGFVKNLMPSQERLAEWSQQSRTATSFNQERPFNMPTKGAISNIVILVRFSDETEFSTGIGYYENMFNSDAAGANSMRNYFREASYNQLTIDSSFYPAPVGGAVVSYQDAHPRRYYQPYSSTNPEGYQGGNDGQERAEREEALAAGAINAISTQVPSSLAIDIDGDGNVDSMALIIKGQPDAWGSLLWPHMHSSNSLNASINGKQVHSYNLQMEALVDNYVLCHEMGHSLGAPDLYNYYSGGDPATYWDLMAETGNPPVHMSAYIKSRYCKWIDTIPTVSSAGTYTIRPLTSATQNAYRINSPKSSTEYYIVEFRKKTSLFENSLPGEGLIIYRINTAQDGQGNWNGPPDELYIYRALRSGNLWYHNVGNAHFSADVGRTAINNFTDPSGLLSNGSAGGLDIANISAVGDTMTFTVGSPPPSLQAQITSVSNSTWHSMCNTVRLYASIRNTGAEPLPAAASVWFWVEGPGVTNPWVGSTPLAGLSYAAQNNFQFDWRIPCLAASGTYTFWARVYIGSTAISEWSASQSFTPATTPVMAQITSLYPVSNATVGGRATLWAEVKNIGSVILQLPSVQFYASGPGFDYSWVGYAYVNGLAVGESKWVSFDWTIPNAASGGTYTYWAIVQGNSGNISDWSYGQTFSVTSGVSASIIGLYPVYGAKAGGSGTLWVQVKNTGGQILPTDAAAWFWVSGLSDPWVGYASVSGLEPGREAWYSFVWNIPRNQTPGSYTYWARAYVGSTALSEWSTGQDFTIAAATVLSTQILSLAPVEGASLGSVAKLKAQVKNTGNVALPSNALVWFLVSGSFFDDSWVGSSSAAGLAVGQSAWFEYAWTIPGSLTAGQYAFKAGVYAGNTAISDLSAEQPFTIGSSIGVTIDFVTVPAGEFQMGSSAQCENPVHRVIISRSFQIGKYEVTQGQWKAVMGNNPSYFTGDDTLPVDRVSWDDVQRFIAALNARNDGYQYRLPTEAEWEYAGRAGTTGDFAGILDEMAWYAGNSGNKTHPAGTTRPNAWGIYDMHGNVWEWVSDYWSCTYYSSSPITDPTGPASGPGRVYRGGGWATSASYCRSAFRYYYIPAVKVNDVGFRLVRTAR